jgi:hypothetical protein
MRLLRKVLVATVSEQPCQGGPCRRGSEIEQGIVRATIPRADHVDRDPHTGDILENAAHVDPDIDLGLEMR